MRIAQVCPYSLSVPGGVQGQVLGLGRALRAMGHETRVLAPCDGPPPDPMVTPLGRSLPTDSNGSVAPIAPDAACALRTLHVLRNERFDIVHIHEPLAPGPSMTALLASEAPTVGTFHASGTRTGYSWMPWLTRRMAQRLHARVAVSNDALHTAQRTLGGEFTVLFNGIEIERFAPATDFVKDAAPKTILFVGRHERRKGLNVLLEAMKHLPQDTRLWVAGTGPQTAALQEATANDGRIEWLGRITDAERTRRLQQADVFVAPSLEGESFGIVLLEGMAAQTPVVASNLPGYRNVGQNGLDALLTDPGDAIALANAIERVFTEDGLAASLVSNGITKADTFSMPNLAAQYLGFYERARAER